MLLTLFISLLFWIRGDDGNSRREGAQEKMTMDELEIDTNAFEARSDKTTCVCWLHTSI